MWGLGGSGEGEGVQGAEQNLLFLRLRLLLIILVLVLFLILFPWLLVLRESVQTVGRPTHPGRSCPGAVSSAWLPGCKGHLDACGPDCMRPGSAWLCPEYTAVVIR